MDNNMNYKNYVLLLKDPTQKILIVKSCSKNDVYGCGTHIIV